MEDINVEDQIIDLMVQKLNWEPPTGTILGGNKLPFSLVKENIHDSKKKFLEEKEIVENGLMHSLAIVQILASDIKENDPNYDPEIVKHLKLVLDDAARNTHRGWVVKTVKDLVHSNAVQVGICASALDINAKIYGAFYERKLELDRQEKEFWSLNSRAPNYYARTIALRLAKLYASQTGTKPTFGTSRDGPHPSTDYGRLLEQVFGILEINAKPNNPAQWAITQIVDEDTAPKRLGRAGLLGMSNFAFPQSKEPE